jgi:Gp37 protein
MTINDIEEALIAHLARVLVGVKVQSFPAKPQDYVLQTANAAVLIRFVEEKPSVEVLGKAGENDLYFDISIVARDFKTQTGVYAFYDAVKKALNQIQFGADAGKAQGLIIRFRGGRYDSYDMQKGLWYYAQRYSTCVPFAPQPIPAATVQRITLADVSYYPDDRNNPDIIIIHNQS